MNKTRTATITALLCIVIAVSAVSTVSASTSKSLSNWDLNSAWNSATFTEPQWNFSLGVNVGNVVLTNATNNGKFVFGIKNASDTGYEIEIVPIAHEADTYLRVGNDVHLIVKTEGVGVTVYDKYLANASSAQLKFATGANLYEFYINGVKVYQNTHDGVSLTKAEWFTANVPKAVGDISEPSCFTGRVSLSVTGSNGASVSFDTSTVTTLLTDMMPLIIGIMTISVVIGVVAIVPKMVKKIKF